MGEFLALELPIVTNGKVGDVARIMAEVGAGAVVDKFDDESYHNTLDELDRLMPDMDRWRAAARRWFDLESGVERYDAIYRAIANAAVGSRKGVG
jgi:glycosyltransferase involved in cell wall biosynthesis